jgi:hypothetical protein
MTTNTQPATGSDARPVPDTEVWDGETIAAACPYCDRPFRAERARDLHVGDVHGDECTPMERDAYEAAAADEDDELFYFHLKVVAALGVLYSALVLLYMVALGSGFF